MSQIDDADRKLLTLLQRNANLTSAQLSEALNLSPSQAARRRLRLEADGFITHHTARVDAEKLGLHVQAFIQVSMASHSPETSSEFRRLIDTQPEIVSMWTMTGEADYLLRVYCQSLKHMNRLVHEVLLPHRAVARLQSQIVMDQIKSDAALPVF